MSRILAIALLTSAIVVLVHDSRANARIVDRLAKHFEAILGQHTESMWPDMGASPPQPRAGRTEVEALSAATQPKGSESVGQSSIKYSESWDEESVTQLMESWNSEPEPLDELGGKLLGKICEMPTIDINGKTVAWALLMGWGVPGSYRAILKGAEESESFAAKILNPDMTPSGLRCSLRSDRFKEKFSDLVKEMTESKVPTGCAAAIVEQLAPEELCRPQSGSKSGG